MTKSSQPSALTTTLRKIYHLLGFQKGYNFLLYFIFGGALLGFVLARLQFLDFFGKFCAPNAHGGASPGECYYYTTFSRYHVGILIHLSTILPAGLLAVFQFVPAIRHKALLYHRMAGWVIFMLVILSNASAVMIADTAFGGGYDVQAWVGLLAILTTLGLVNAVANVKRLQIDQHRAWMLRVWFWLGSIVTTRLILIISVQVLAAWPKRGYTVFPCAKLVSILGQEAVGQKYPVCAPGLGNTTDATQAVVQEDFNGGTENIGAALDGVFGMSLWLAFFMHAVGVEMYLRLTPKEGERLREVSYQRQMERGMRNPGSAGLVPEKIGDMDAWVSKDQKLILERKDQNASDSSAFETIQR